MLDEGDGERLPAVPRREPAFAAALKQAGLELKGNHE
jgi:hypothetical protein